MNDQHLNLTYEIEVHAGEAFALPRGVAERIPAGRWRITIESLDRIDENGSPRGHSAFLNAYAPSDEGLYDDLPTR